MRGRLHVKMLQMKTCVMFVWLLLFALLHISGAEQFHIERFMLKNGLRCVIAQVKQAPIVSVSAAIKLGAEHELGAYASGVRFMLSQALVTGTRLQQEDDLIQTLSLAGAKLTFSVEPDCLIFQVVSSPQGFDTALQLLSDVLIRPSLDERCVEVARVKTLAYQKMLSTTPLLWAKQSVREMLFSGSPYARPICGYERTVKRIRREHLLDFFDAYFRAGNMSICVAGDVDVKLATTQLTATFRSLPSGLAPAIERVKISPRNEPQHSVRQFYGELAQILVAFAVPGINDPDAPKLLVLSSIIGDGVGSRLYKHFREMHGWAYYAKADCELGADFGELLIHIATESGKIEAVRKTLEELLLELHLKEVSVDELKYAKQMAITKLEMSMQDVSQLSTILARLEVNGISPRRLFDLRDSIEALSAQDVLAVAKRYLRCAAVAVLLPM
jgi:zinc protease